MEEESLRIVREEAPDIRLGWSVPKLRRNYLANPFTRWPALLAAQYVRTVLPGRAARAISEGRVDAIMSHWALVTPRMARAIERRAASSTCGRSTTRRGSPARRDRRHRGHHERPAAVRYRVISHDERDTRR